MYRYSRATLIVLLFLIIAGYLWTMISVLRFPYTVDYGEAPLMDQSRRIFSPEQLYKSSYSDAPYVNTNYPPLYVFIMACMAKITGANLLLTGRVISITASIVTGLLLASLTKSITNNNLSALVALGLFISHPFVLTWSPLARVDLLAILLCVLGLFTLYHRWSSWGWVTVAGVFFLAAIYTRQSYLLAGPLGGFTWLLSRDRYRAIAFAGGLSLSVLGLFLGINKLTHGGFYLNIIQANINQYDISILGGMFKHFLLIWPVTILVCIGYLQFLLVLRHRTNNPKPDPFITYGWLVFCLGAFLSSLTIGKVGSGVNYFLELIAACAVLGAVSFDHLYRGSFRYKSFIILIFSCQLIWLLAGGFYQYQSTIASRWKQLHWYQQLSSQVRTAVDQGPVLSDDYLGMVVQAGQEVIYQPFEYGQLYQAGFWNPGLLAEEIRSGAFTLILIGGETLNKSCCWPPELVSAIQQRYQIDYQPGIILCTPYP